MEIFALLALGLVVLILGGSVCGISAIVRIRSLKKLVQHQEVKLNRMDRQLGRLENLIPEAQRTPEVPVEAPAEARPEVGAPPLVQPRSGLTETPPPKIRPPEPERVREEALEEALEEPLPEFGDRLEEEMAGAEAVPVKGAPVDVGRSVPPPISPAAKAVASGTPPPDRPSLEMIIGGKWLSWAGIGMVIIAVGFGLKYAYDNSWIGLEGRLAIGCLAGIVALGAGEYFRRKDWSVLFQTLTGGGIAIFYVCIYFSFQVYGLSGPEVSFGAAILVTVLGVVMAVAHNALSTAVIAVAGGFLSPILFSEGGNHPYTLFTYIAILDLMALGAAYYRRWRALDILCFSGTILMYFSWFNSYYTDDFIVPGLIFATLFYLMFLVIPTLYSLARREPHTNEGLTLIAANAVLWLYIYYNILFDDYRMYLGFVVIGQAILVFVLFRTWVSRMGSQDRTSESLLIIALALATLAIPVTLRAYGIAIAWSVEGILFIYLGIRFEKLTCKLGGAAALVLATGKLILELPLHDLPFMPIINPAFLSWSIVCAAAFGSAFLLLRLAKGHEEQDRPMALAVFLLGYVLTCVLLTLEVSTYWTVHRPTHYWVYLFDSLVLLWTVIPTLTLAAVWRLNLDPRALILPWAAYGVGALVVFTGFGNYFDGQGVFPLANLGFVSRLAFIASAWWASRISRQRWPGPAGDVFEVASYGLLMILLAFEFPRWGHATSRDIARLAPALVSAAWAFEGLALIWAGLLTRMRFRRYVGFGVFGITIGKVLLFDTSELADVYRIVSFMACGIFMLAAAYFYQRFSSVLLGEEEKGHAEP